jgi:DnaJ-domain-containing protein 1
MSADNDWRARLLRTARAGLNRVQDEVVAFERDGGIDGLRERVAETFNRREQALLEGQHTLNPEYVRQLQTWYARLETPYGSDAATVRRAFRDLMRRYHPDRFTDDPEREAKATRLSQELTVAYEGLIAHLER